MALVTDIDDLAIDIDGLVRRVAQRAAADHDSLPAPASDDRIAQAEAQLGFSLHPLLARLYREVADGGFGPEYRLLPLLGPGASIAGEYLERHEKSVVAEFPSWPHGIVPILTYGCGMYAAVDCLNKDGQVLLFDPNSFSDGAWDECWYFDMPSFAAWLGVWLEGAGWFEEDADSFDDVLEPQPWEEAADRLACG